VTPLRQVRAGLALGWYLVTGVGVPLLDGALFHNQTTSHTAHIESSDSDCHRGECSFEAPGAPQSPAGAPVGVGRLEAIRFTAAAPPSWPAPRDRSLARANSPRAPPHLT
jgi:hypothetical protein